MNKENSLRKKKKSIALFAYLQALRPRQWTKNLIIFAAPLFAFTIDWQSFLNTSVAFILFCCASSSFYLLNDIADVESDRRHPVKCHRPIASGLVSIPIALGLSIILLGTAIIVGWLQAPALGLAIIGYAFLQIIYNLLLKHKPIVDIIAIATGFVLRAYAGVAATGVDFSPWFVMCTAMLALFLGIEKRKAELRLSQRQGVKTRSVLRRYSLPLLTRMESTVTTGALMSYSIWSAGPVVNGATTPWMMLTIPFVLYGIFRYQLLSDPNERVVHKKLNNEEQITERPDEVLLSDTPILLTVVGWIITSSVILYLNKQGMI